MDLQFKKEAEETEIEQNCPGLQQLGDVAAKPKPMCYTAGIGCTKEANNCCTIHFRYRRDHQHILLKLSIPGCACIYILRKITFATSFFCKEPPCMMK